MDSGKEGEMISLRCKVMSKSETQTVFSHALKKDLKKCKVYVCVNCNAKTPDNDEEDEFLKCRSCKLTMLKHRMSSAVFANIVIEQDGESIGRFYCSGNVLNEMFISISETKNYKINETDTAKLS